MNNITFLPKDGRCRTRCSVQEEWRRRLSPMLRIDNKKVLLKYRILVMHYDPIGDMDIIKTISAKRVADFLSQMVSTR